MITHHKVVPFCVRGGVSVVVRWCKRAPEARISHNSSSSPPHQTSRLVSLLDSQVGSYSRTTLVARGHSSTRSLQLACVSNRALSRTRPFCLKGRLNWAVPSKGVMRLCTSPSNWTRTMDRPSGLPLDACWEAGQSRAHRHPQPHPDACTTGGGCCRYSCMLGLQVVQSMKLER